MIPPPDPTRSHHIPPDPTRSHHIPPISCVLKLKKDLKMCLCILTF
jgi:hypothetical protein